jgi:ferrochelatase
VSDRRTGVLLVNLGTPRAPRPREVRRYLREFLSDPRVIDLPAPLRWVLLNLVILPTRPRSSARAYREIWSDAGSPLLVHGRALRDAVAKVLGADYRVELGMRYGEPSIPQALSRLDMADTARLVVLPLFPQYSSAATGSALARVLEEVARANRVPPLHAIGPFHDEPGYLRACAAVAGSALASFRPDHVLSSFHGLPERQVRAADPGGAQCLAREDCCGALGDRNRDCYRAQCFATARALAAALDLAPRCHSVAFQSRLGRTPWIRPHTDQVLPELAGAGVRRLAVLCPSFVADCLETLEEIGIRARAQWQALGGEDFLLVPSLNAEPDWVECVADLVRSAAPRSLPVAITAGGAE